MAGELARNVKQKERCLGKWEMIMSPFTSCFQKDSPAGLVKMGVKRVWPVLHVAIRTTLI